MNLKHLLPPTTELSFVYFTCSNERYGRSGFLSKCPTRMVSLFYNGSSKPFSSKSFDATAKSEVEMGVRTIYICLQIIQIVKNNNNYKKKAREGLVKDGWGEKSHAREPASS